MGSRSRNAVGIILFAVGILFLVTGAFFWMRHILGSSDSSYKEPYCVVELEDISELGRNYEGIEAEEGYSFYKLSFSVKNTGEGEAYRDIPSLYYESEDYDAVYDKYYWETEQGSQEEMGTPLFYGYEKACIPPGRTGKASDVLMVKDGVEQITAYYYPGYSDEELALEIIFG